MLEKKKEWRLQETLKEWKDLQKEYTLIQNNILIVKDKN